MSSERVVVDYQTLLEEVDKQLGKEDLEFVKEWNALYKGRKHFDDNKRIAEERRLDMLDNFEGAIVFDKVKKIVAENKKVLNKLKRQRESKMDIVERRERYLNRKG